MRLPVAAKMALAMAGATGGSAMRMEWEVRVTSPTRMEGDSIVRVTVPSACTLSTPFTFVRQ